MGIYIGEGISCRGQATRLNREKGDGGGLGGFIGGMKGEVLNGRRA